MSDMLNLTQPPKYSAEELEYISTLDLREDNQWDSTKSRNKALKKNIRAQMRQTQENRCAYCGFLLDVTSRADIEHIALKKVYPQFMYEPYNLVLACTFCNYPPHKGQKDVIEAYDPDYKKCTFSIIHPYFDIPENFMEVEEDADYIIVLKKGLSDKAAQKAKNTIEMFELNSPGRRHQRMLEANYNLRTDEKAGMIEAIVAYRPMKYAGFYKGEQEKNSEFVLNSKF